MIQAVDHYWGYKRENGSPGIRNYLLVLNVTGLTEPTAKRVHTCLPGSVYASTPYGMGMLGFDAERTIATLSGLGLNPNVGAVLVLSADRPRAEAVCEKLKEGKKLFHAIVFDEVEHDSLTMTDQALRAGALLGKQISLQQRTKVDIATLMIGMECGLSDPSSGITANLLLGRVTDEHIAQRGSVVFGETLEWLGCEDVLVTRAAHPELGERLQGAVLDREKMAQDAGIDLNGINPNQTNIAGGLTTIEEKASGSIAKSGTVPISGLLQFSERPKTAGLYAMDAPSYSPESLTGFVAAGAQLICFTTGLGNSYCSAVTPTIKLTGNDQTAQRLNHQIDFDCSAILAEESLEAETNRFWQEVVSVSNGGLTYGEILGEGGEAISRFGAAL